MTALRLEVIVENQICHSWRELEEDVFCGKGLKLLIIKLEELPRRCRSFGKWESQNQAFWSSSAARVPSFPGRALRFGNNAALDTNIALLAKGGSRTANTFHVMNRLDILRYCIGRVPRFFWAAFKADVVACSKCEAEVWLYTPLGRS